MSSSCLETGESVHSSSERFFKWGRRQGEPINLLKREHGTIFSTCWSDWLALRKLIFCHHLKMKRWFLVSSRLHCVQSCNYLSHICSLRVILCSSETCYRRYRQTEAFFYVRKSRLGWFLMSSKGIPLGYWAWINNFLPFTFSLTDLALKNQDMSRANTKGVTLWKSQDSIWCLIRFRIDSRLIE